MEQETNIVFDFSKRIFWLIAGLIVVVAIFFIGQIYLQDQNLPQNAPQNINVTGEGKVYARPDVALISFGAHTQADKSQDAVNQNNKIMNAVVKSIKDFGVEDKDVQTTSYNLSPVYDYTRNGTVFKGYSLDQQISVKIRNFDKINDILDGAASGGANTIGSLQFTVDDMTKAQSEARAKAIAAAKVKADSLIGQAGFKSVKLINISEGYSPVPQPMYGKGGGMMVESNSIAPQIQAGQTEVDSSVTLTYQVK